MKTVFTFLIAVLFYTACFPQNTKTDTLSAIDVDELPSFPGSDSLLNKYLVSNFSFEKAGLLYKSSVYGPSVTIATRIPLSFIVTSEGKIVKTKVLSKKKFEEDIDNEIIRVFENMPLWNPAKKNGIPVHFKYLCAVFVGQWDDKKGESKEISVAVGIVEDFSRDTFYKPYVDKLYNNGVQKSQMGDFINAIKDFDQALKLIPSDTDLLYNRGVLKIKIFDKEGACKDWDLIKRLGSNDADELFKKYCN